ncbi:MAG: toxin HipA [Legionellales bacterium RIFCSPHIGHO2_12_FULL_37_14]|nr:MAG: toxin HipA [Legionellales bacterium RIFCSPHIGHO2_12_FULL_37_14]
MRKARILMHGVFAGLLHELEDNTYQFTYHNKYKGPQVSLTMPVTQQSYTFEKFPAFFEGLLPEGTLLEALVAQHNLDKEDFFGQLLKVGNNVVGAVSIEELK